MDVQTKLHKCHIKLMKHPETCLYSGVILMGKSEIVDNIPTACTDGVNTKYGRAFMEKLTEPETCALILHENLHKALRHLLRYNKLMKEDPQTTNAAMDYVVNDLIMQIKDSTLCSLPKERLWDIRFRNWSVLQVFDYLKSGNPPPPPPSGGQGKGNPQPGQGQGKPLPKGKPKRGDTSVTIGDETFKLGGLDEHDINGLSDLTMDDIKDLDKKVTEALQQGGLLAGRMGAKVPRVIKDSIVDPVDWAAEMRDFVCTSTVGRTEYTYRKYNRRFLADDIYMPSTEDETVGEVIFGIDTSGSIGQEILNAFGKRVYEVCEIAKPDAVRILWWDTNVHGEQVFQPNQYDQIQRLLKPMGGGGTHAGCVAKYIRDKKLNACCAVMFTDGYTEQPVDWGKLDVPTLWLVTHNTQFQVPPGNRKVKVERSMMQ